MGKNIHMIGMCGIGMSSVALLLKEQGNRVTGSDAECYGPPKLTLSEAGLAPLIGYRTDNIPTDTDYFVIGRNAKLAREMNEEVDAAYRSGKPTYSFPEVLGTLTEGRRNVVVAGSYGKSTTTALLAHVLNYAGIPAGYFIGAEPVDATPAKLGADPLFILEGDEYPSGHDDPRAKFLHLHPHDVLLSSVVHDHVNVYPTFDSYQKPFKELLTLVPENGLVTVCADELGALSLAKASGKTLVTYGKRNGTFGVRDAHFSDITAFTLTQNDIPIAHITSQLLGWHNIENILAMAAYVLTRELLTGDQLVKAVETFKGVRRRLDAVAPRGRIPVFEGFGSSYEKATAAIAAVKLHYPTKRLVVFFEPHTFGWRNRANLPWYDNAFSGVSLLLVAPPASQGAGTHDQLSSEEILARVKATGIDAHPYDSKHPTEHVSALTEGDVVLILTSGDFEGTLPTLVAAFEKQFPSV